MSQAVARTSVLGDCVADDVVAQYDLDSWDLRLFGHDCGWVRFRGRPDRRRRGEDEISQAWLLGLAKQWVLRAALRRISADFREVGSPQSHCGG